METLRQVAIILVNWNGCDDTLECLDSLRRLDYPHTVLVIDNGSTDGLVDAVRASYPEVTTIEAGENLGFVGGNNAGLKRVLSLGVDYAFLLNNDTVVAPDSLRLLVEAAEADPTVGIVGPTIYYAGRPGTVWSAGGAINWRQGSTRMLELDEDDCGQFGASPRPVDFVTGCALLIKRQVLDEIGLLDPRFFAYYEEVEWCVRATRAGWTILHVPLAKIWHKITPQDRAASPRVHYYMTRNRLLFLKVTHAGWRAWVHTGFEYVRTLMSWTFKPRWRHMRSQRSMMVRAILDYLTEG